jgi:predicted kinase
MPFYPDEVSAPVQQPRAHRAAVQRPAEPAAVQQPPARPERPPRQERPAKQEWTEPEDSGRFELETQPEYGSTPPPEAEAAERSPQAPKGYVVLAIGLPGSGKTTWFRRRGVTPLSSDLLRNILFDDVEEQRYQGLVFSTLRSLLRARLIARMPWNYVDATNLSIHERRQWIKMSKSFGYEVQAVFFDVPLEVCLERNSKRDRSVSSDVMRKMAEKLKPPVFEEGFAKITVVRVKNAG